MRLLFFLLFFNNLLKIIDKTNEMKYNCNKNIVKRRGAVSKIMKTTKITKKTWKDIGFVAALVSIPILQFLIFYVFINGNVILLAFQKENNAFTFDNFLFLFRYFGSSNSKLLEALVNTLKFFALQLLFVFSL